MIWLTWRQFRAQAITAAAVLAAVAILLGATGPHLAGLYAASGLTRCDGDNCANLANSFLNQLTTDGLYHVGYTLGLVLILAAPAILGIFWGAPLIAREFEAGTYRLAWNQSVTRTRWLTVKLALTGLAAMAVTEALALMHAWWADPISKAIALGGGGGSVFGGGRFNWTTFATNGITPLGYAAFAFALGTAAGTLIRRTVPAMAVTLAIFAAVQFVMPLWVRPYVIPPSHTVVSVASLNSLRPQTFPGQPGAWVLSTATVNAAGQPVTAAPAACLSLTSGKDASEAPYLDCIASHGIRETITYQPASRYWPLQWIETGIFLALALALAGFCFWRLDRRRALRADKALSPGAAASAPGDTL
jgi:ABC-2 family transporter protein